MHSNQVLYEEPPERQPKQKGRPAITWSQVQALGRIARARPAGGKHFAGAEAGLEGLSDRSAFRQVAASGWHGALRAVSQAGRHTALQTTADPFLDWSNYYRLGGPVTDVSVWLCHGAYVPLPETEAGVDHRQLARPGRRANAGFGVVPCLLPTLAHAPGSCRQAPALAAAQGRAHCSPADPRTGAAPGAHLFAGVGHTGSAYRDPQEKALDGLAGTLPSHASAIRWSQSGKSSGNAADFDGYT